MGLGINRFRVVGILFLMLFIIAFVKQVIKEIKR